MKLNKAIEVINKHISLFECFENVYIFGSILQRDKISNDIDLLLVYLDYSNNLLKRINTIYTVLEEEIGIYVDLTVLSLEEVKDTKFFEKIGYSYIAIK